MVNATYGKNNIMKNMMNKEMKVTDGLFFEIRLTSRYINIMGIQAFEKLNIDISFEEYLIMDILSYNEGICPRDLARMLLRDRSNLGKVINELARKKIIKIKPSIRNNRAVKSLYITNKGLEIRSEIYEKIEPYLKIFDETITDEEQKMLGQYLQKCRKILDDIVETKI